MSFEFSLSGTRGFSGLTRAQDNLIVAVGSSGILKEKQKLGVIINSEKLGGIHFTKFSKLTMCRTSEA